jgi:hypothetical protein
MDGHGRGWLVAADIRLHLTTLASKWHQYAPARLAQILADGHGIFWTYDGERVWLRRPAAVAAALGLERVRGRLVELKRNQVVGGVGRFKAHLFAAWLANHQMPLSQRRIEEMTGIPARSQRRYCTAAGVTVRENICIGPRRTPDNKQEIYWQYAGAFEFTDWLGKQGPAGRVYMAWHLPSGYETATPTGSRSQQRRMQKQVSGLATNGAPGNSHLLARPSDTRLFYVNGKVAAQVINRGADSDVYWRMGTARRRPCRGLWAVFRGDG